MEHLFEGGGAMLRRPSHPLVHPAPAVELAAQAQGQGPAAAAAQPPDVAAVEQGQGGNAPPPGVLMVDLLVAPGTRLGLGTRLAQAVLAAATIAFMASAKDFHLVTAFRHLVAAASLQCLWCLSLATMDVYALLVKRSFRTPLVTCIFSIGDWVTGVLIFVAASGSAAITVFIHDVHMCSENHCQSFRAATAIALLSWFAMALSFLFNLWAAVYRVQGP